MSTRINDAQKRKFLEFILENRDILCGVYTNNQGKKAKEAKWIELNDAMNAIGPAKKDVEKWKRTWADLKMATKGKKRDLRKHHNRTGGGSPPPENLQLNEFDDLIIAICGNTEMDGDENICEAGFGGPKHMTFPKNVCQTDNSKKLNSPKREILHEIIVLDDDNNESENSKVAPKATACKRLFNSSANDDSTTPKKVSKQNIGLTHNASTSSVSPSTPSTPTKRQFNQQQNNIDIAIAAQQETNQLLKQIVLQNSQILNRLDFFGRFFMQPQAQQQKQSTHKD